MSKFSSGIRANAPNLGSGFDGSGTAPAGNGLTMLLLGGYPTLETAYFGPESTPRQGLP